MPIQIKDPVAEKGLEKLIKNRPVKASKVATATAILRAVASLPIDQANALIDGVPSRLPVGP